MWILRSRKRLHLDTLYMLTRVSSGRKGGSCLAFVSYTRQTKTTLRYASTDGRDLPTESVDCSGGSRSSRCFSVRLISGKQRAPENYTHTFLCTRIPSSPRSKFSVSFRRSPHSIRRLVHPSVEAHSTSSLVRVNV